VPAYTNFTHVAEKCWCAGRLRRFMTVSLQAYLQHSFHRRSATDSCASPGTMRLPVTVTVASCGSSETVGVFDWLYRTRAVGSNIRATAARRQRCRWSMDKRRSLSPPTVVRSTGHCSQATWPFYSTTTRSSCSNATARIGLASSIDSLQFPLRIYRRYVGCIKSAAILRGYKPTSL